MSRALARESVERQRFRKGMPIQGWRRNSIFSQTGIPRLGRLSLPVQGQS